MDMRGFARGVSAAGLIAASLAALPSLDWCPIADWTAGPCMAASACDAGAPECGPVVAGSCDREPDPIPFGDNVWCIRPPVTALTVRADELPEPREGATPALLTETRPLTPPAPAGRVRLERGPGPPALRAPHAPPQPRAPPVG